VKQHGSTNLLALVNVVDSTVDNKEAFQDVIVYCVAGMETNLGSEKKWTIFCGLSSDVCDPTIPTFHTSLEGNKNNKSRRQRI
jgi:hypothetical protein